MQIRQITKNCPMQPKIPKNHQHPKAKPDHQWQPDLVILIDL